LSLLTDRGVFVTGTDTGVGKTVVTAALGLAAQAQGRSVICLKPAQTGWVGETTSDPEFVQTVLGTDEPFEAVCPYAMAAPLAPSVAAALEGRRLDPSVVVQAHRALAERYDVVIVEGAGGLLVPFSDGVDMGGLAALLEIPLIVVARPGLGTLNHTLLTLESLHRRGATVLGVVISGYPERPGLDALTNPGVLARLTPVPLLGVIPHDPDIDTEGGIAGDLARIEPGRADPLLGGTFSHARWRRGVEELLRRATDPSHA